LFLKSGEVEHVTLIDGGSGDCRVKIYDTEDPTMLPLGALRENLATLAADATEQPGLPLQARLLRRALRHQPAGDPTPRQSCERPGGGVGCGLSRPGRVTNEGSRSDGSVLGCVSGERASRNEMAGLQIDYP
jgi:hypothetical protein